MPRPKRAPISKSRPKIPIDWEMVDRLLMANCDGASIARKIGMHPETFYDRVVREKGIGYTEYRSQKVEDGNTLLHQVQFKKAMNGDNTMIIWLGKNRMKQSDKVETKTEIKGEIAVKAILELPDNGRRKRE